LPRAIAASVSAQQTAVICGPSLGGLLYMLSPTGVYATCTAVFIAASVLISLIRVARRSDGRQPINLETLFAGFRYIRSRPILLGAISLDLFAVLLGGVTALLPIYARDILQAGPWALGLLRSAPAVGALAISVVLARRAIGGSAGRMMYTAVGTFGLASLAFGLSTSVPLSFLALVIYGASDAISVVIRQSLVQMRTPYEMLGRAGRGAVSADRRLGHDRGDADLDVGIPATSPRRQIDAGGRSGAVTATLGPTKVRSFRACPRPRIIDAGG